MEYRVKRNCGWGDRFWTPGQTIADGDVPADVVKVLLARDSVEPAGRPPKSAGKEAAAEATPAEGAAEGAPEGSPGRFDELPDHGAEPTPRRKGK